jgi:hypothetical protein
VEPSDHWPGVHLSEGPRCFAVALPGRILWAWVGGFYVAPHLALGGLAFGMAVSIGLIGAFTPHWRCWRSAR